MEELRLDYQDFLRQRRLQEWPKEDPRRKELVARRCTTADEIAAWVKLIAQREGLLQKKNGPDEQHGQDGQAAEIPPSIKSMPSISSIFAELSANAALILVGVACSLVSRQVAAQAKAFEAEGGFTERLYRIRSTRRGKPPETAA